jgi:acyl-CoA thioesterase-1
MTASLQQCVERLGRGERISIAGLGDSLTAGWMVPRGFFDQFIDILAETYQTAAVVGMNAGVPGDTAEGGLARIGGILDESPDVVTIQFGINDMYMGIPVASFERSIRAVVVAVQSTGSLPILVTSCPMRSERDRKAIVPYYEAIAEAGRDLKAPVADTASFWLAHMESWAGLLQADGVHPTFAGHRLMAHGLASLF